ncbi:MAG: hypothetical protein JKY94_00970 [Rhodobacteraceae bacterium]|nr:hypothetical protein [Paracoccaceae bacterium]
MDELKQEPPKNTGESTGDVPDARRQLVQNWCALVRGARDDAKGHKKAFNQMRDNMSMARLGAKKEWLESGKYTANILQRHVAGKVSMLYAKNPTATAKRRERLDFSIWDGNAESLLMAQQTLALAAQGQALPQAIVQAEALLKDFQNGSLERQLMDALGKTIVILFNYFMDEQDPHFKTQMKQLVRRTVTNGVGYLKLGFQREVGHDLVTMQGIDDARTKIATMERILREMGDGDTTETEAEAEQLRLQLQDLQATEQIVLREGLIFDFPKSTSIIVDPVCTNLMGFVGANWIAHEIYMTVDRVKEIFSIDLKAGNTSGSGQQGNFLPYQMKSGIASPGGPDGSDAKNMYVCVWEIYDKKTGMTYVVADGHPDFLTEPASPQVQVNGFFPIFALTFNEVESEDEVFPPSDVELLSPLQEEYNRSREGLREHRAAARPRWAVAQGALSEDDKEKLSSQAAFTVVELQALEGQSIGDALQSISIPGVDPNLYETGSIMTDVQLVAGSQEANFGSTSGSTATESSIAEGSRMSSAKSNIDDLDDFLTASSRAAGQVLLAEMSPDQVTEIVGSGAVWPELMPDNIAKEVFIEIEAGSSGRPNSAQEINNLQLLMPYLLQIPGISGEWLAKIAIQRMDDTLDLTDAIIPGVASITAQNGSASAPPASGGSSDVPASQGNQGGQNQPVPPQPSVQASIPPGGGNQGQAGSGLVV